MSASLTRRRVVGALLAAAAGSALPRRASGANAPLTLGLQTGGTTAWEIAAMQRLGLAQKNGVEITVRPVADSAAGQVALLSGAVDLILSDLIWASAQCTQGHTLLFVPFSLAVGGLVIGAESTVADLAGLHGQTIGVGGGPLDKNLTFLRACYRHETGRSLVDDVSLKYGAAPLINELLQRRQLGGALNFWQWNARAVRQGAKPLISVAGMLARLGVPRPPPLLGWTFTAETASMKRDGVGRLLEASFDTKRQLLVDDAVWQAIRPQMDVGEDDVLFRTLRDGYRAGIVTSYDPDDLNASEATFRILAETAGPAAVGNAHAFDPAVFWKEYRR